MKVEDFYVEKEVHVKHQDGWGYSIKEIDEDGIIEYLIQYWENEDGEYVKNGNPFSISVLLAEEFFNQALQLTKKEK
jgi:hypothetical protein